MRLCLGPTEQVARGAAGQRQLGVGVQKGTEKQGFVTKVPVQVG